jgi:hypothetical protein
MTYTNTWDDTVPPDTQLANLIGQDIRNLSLNVHQRMDDLTNGTWGTTPGPMLLAPNVFITQTVVKQYAGHQFLNDLVAGHNLLTYEAAGVRYTPLTTSQDGIVVMGIPVVAGAIITGVTLFYSIANAGASPQITFTLYRVDTTSGANGNQVSLASGTASGNTSAVTQLNIQPTAPGYTVLDTDYIYVDLQCHYSANVTVYIQGIQVTYTTNSMAIIL